MKSSMTEIAIEVSELRKSYDGNDAVDGISFNVPKGTVFSLIGPNGAGKTTTVSILEGLLRRNEGEVKILGMDPWTNHNELKIKIGVLPQRFNFFEKLNPMESIKFYCSLFNSSIDPESILKAVSLADSVKTPFESLSGGQKQKVGLALALVNNPEILFLDEPTTGLDPISRRAIWSIIRNFKQQGRTVVLTTHYMEEAEKLSDIVAIIDHGKLIEIGSPMSLEIKNAKERRLTIKTDDELADYLRKRGVDLLYTEGSVSIPIGKGQSLATIVDMVESSRIRYSHLSVNDENLEDVYLKLIGKRKDGEAI